MGVTSGVDSGYQQAHLATHMLDGVKSSLKHAIVCGKLGQAQSRHGWLSREQAGGRVKTDVAGKYPCQGCFLLPPPTHQPSSFFFPRKHPFLKLLSSCIFLHKSLYFTSPSIHRYFHFSTTFSPSPSHSSSPFLSPLILGKQQYSLTFLVLTSQTLNMLLKRNKDATMEPIVIQKIMQDAIQKQI